MARLPALRNRDKVKPAELEDARLASVARLEELVARRKGTHVDAVGEALADDVPAEASTVDEDATARVPVPIIVAGVEPAGPVEAVSEAEADAGSNGHQEADPVGDDEIVALIPLQAPDEEPHPWDEVAGMADDGHTASSDGPAPSPALLDPWAAPRVANEPPEFMVAPDVVADEPANARPIGQVDESTDAGALKPVMAAPTDLEPRLGFHIEDGTALKLLPPPADRPEAALEVAVAPASARTARATSNTARTKATAKATATPKPTATATQEAAHARPVPKRSTGRATAPAIIAVCPSCGTLLDPPPDTSRKCRRCRERIVVRRVHNGVAFVTSSAARAMDVERREAVEGARWARERARWHTVAVAAGAPANKLMRLEATAPSAESVDAMRRLYLTATESAYRSAKREHRWLDAAAIRRKQALTLQRAGGSIVPPPPEILELHREAVEAELRSLRFIGRDAELVGTDCCDACRADHGYIGRITTELAAHRLPHERCPVGLCRCRWHPARRDWPGHRSRPPAKASAAQ